MFYHEAVAFVPTTRLDAGTVYVGQHLIKVTLSLGEVCLQVDDRINVLQVIKE